MAYSKEYSAQILEFLGAITPVRGKPMFGGLGIYGRELFFALIDEDRLYFKVDDTSRPDFEAKGMGPFVPYEGAPPMRGYYELPLQIVEDPDDLSVWVDQALGVAERAKAGKAKKKKA